METEGSLQGLHIPASPELLAAINSLEDPNNVDMETLEKLGVDVEALHKIIEDSITNQISSQFEAAAEALDAVEWNHPFLLGLYAILLILAILLFTVQTLWFPVLLLVAILVLCGFSDEINVVLHETIGETWFEKNPFDPMGLFVSLELSPLFLGLAGLCIIRIIWILCARCCCSQSKAKAKKNALPKHLSAKAEQQQSTDNNNVLPHKEKQD